VEDRQRQRSYRLQDWINWIKQTSPGRGGPSVVPRVLNLQPGVLCLFCVWFVGELEAVSYSRSIPVGGEAQGRVP
jgi:hypothetical protein